MLVYRVEHKDTHRGPYSGKHIVNSMANCHNNDFERWPTPYYDGISVRYSEPHRYGFDSLDKLRSWFYGYLGVLNDRGFIIVVVRIHGNSVKRGEKQVVYDPTKGKIVNKLELKGN